MYAPPGSVNVYENVELIKGTWRRESQELTSFLPFQNLPRKFPEYVKEIRDTVHLSNIVE